MNKKTIYFMLIALGVLLVFSFLLKSFDSTTSSPESFTALDIDFDQELIAKIDIFKRDFPDSGLHFIKTNTVWVVSNEYGAPAKSDDVEKLMADLNAVSGQVRGEAAELYAEFDITDENALQIEMYDSEGSKLVHVYIGKGGSGRESFMRIAGSPVVYLANENFISRFAAWQAPPEKKLPADRWIELALCDIPRADVKSFKITKSKTEYEFALIEEPSEDSLAPPSEVWTQLSPKKGFKLEESKIKRLHSSLVGLRASGVTNPESKDKFGLDKPKNAIWIADAGGNSVSIKFSKPVNDDGERYAMIEGKDAVYTVPKHTFERVFEDPFKKPDK